jgi:hypothetical protein
MGIIKVNSSQSKAIILNASYFGMERGVFPNELRTKK